MITAEKKLNKVHLSREEVEKLIGHSLELEPNDYPKTSEQELLDLFQFPRLQRMVWAKNVKIIWAFAWRHYKHNIIIGLALVYACIESWAKVAASTSGSGAEFGFGLLGVVCGIVPIILFVYSFTSDSVDKWGITSKRALLELSLSQSNIDYEPPTVTGADEDYKIKKYAQHHGIPYSAALHVKEARTKGYTHFELYEPSIIKQVPRVDPAIIGYKNKQDRYSWMDEQTIEQRGGRLICYWDIAGDVARVEKELKSDG